MSSKNNDIPGSKEFKKIEQLLQKEDTNLFDRYRLLKDAVSQKLAPRQQKQDDTESGTLHLESVLRNLELLLPAEKAKHLNGMELFCLLAAVWLHDVGKIVEMKASKGVHHSELSKSVITEQGHLFNLEKSWSNVIAYIVEGHGPISLNDIPETKRISPYGEIRIRYLAALLKLADDLETTYTRAPGIAFAVTKPNTKITGKWGLRQAIDGVAIDSAAWTIELSATPRSSVELNRVLKEIGKMNKRLSESSKHLKQYPEVALHYSRIGVKIDENFIRRKSKNGDERIKLRSSPYTAEATNVVILGPYDQAFLRTFDEVVAPTLRRKGFIPILIEKTLPVQSLSQRAYDLISCSPFVIAVIPSNPAPSFYLRLGIALGLRKKLLAFADPTTPIPSDLVGSGVSTFRTLDELRLLLDSYIPISTKAKA